MKRKVSISFKLTSLELHGPLLKLPVSGIFFLVGPKQASGEAHAGDGEQKRTPVVLEHHLLGPVLSGNDELTAAQPNFPNSSV